MASSHIECFSETGRDASKRPHAATDVYTDSIILEDKVREISFDGNLTMYLSLLPFLIVSNSGIACLKIHNLLILMRL